MRHTIGHSNKRGLISESFSISKKIRRITILSTIHLRAVARSDRPAPKDAQDSVKNFLRSIYLYYLTNENNHRYIFPNSPEMKRKIFVTVIIFDH
jgi:hypothetical protein